MNIKQTNTDTLVKAARLYYKNNFSQQQVARELKISRPGVSRLLKKARNKGIVKIEIIDPSKNRDDLANSITRKYHLKRTIIVPNGSSDTEIIKKRLGAAAAKLLNEIVDDEIILGVSWGSTMREVAKQIISKRLTNLVVVQLNGGVSRTEYDTHASEIAQMIGQSYDTISYLLPLPAIVDKAEVKRAIISDKNITRTLELSRRSRIAMFTIGSFGRESVLVKSDYFEPEEVDNLLKDGAVGDICSRIIDHNGKICSQDLDARTIGIELEELQNKEYSIAIAGGKQKFSAIKAGLKGKLFNTLITDEWVGNELLSSLQKDENE